MYSIYTYALASSLSQANQGQPRLRVTLTLQVLWRFDEHHFQSRLPMRFEEMAPMGCPVSFADHHVRMHLGFALLERNIAHQRQDFDLLRERNAPVILLFSVEIAHDDITEGAESGEVATIKMVLPGKVEQS